MDQQNTLFQRQPDTEIPLVKRIFIGADPGYSKGAIAAIIYTGDGTRVVKDMRISKGSLTDLSDFLKELASLKESDGYTINAIFEKVHSMPKQGVSSTFKFGKGAGRMEALLIAHKIPFEEKTPQTWQKIYSIKRKKDESSPSWKNQLKGMAQQIFPDVKLTLEECDAYLIAEYCKTFYKN